MTDYEIFELGDFVFQSGATLRNAKLAYKTYGTLNADKSNVIVYPTWYSVQHYDNEWLIGEGMALDPRGDIGNTPGFDGNFEKALGAIKAKAIVMPAEMDLYFPPEDNEYEVKFMQNAEFRVIKSVWGHFAGGGVNLVDTQFIDENLKELLAI